MSSKGLDFFFTGGVSVIVGTVDRDGNPSCCRGVALASADGGKTITVYVPVATGQDIIANIATTRRIAVGSTYPPDHSAIQLKGTTAGARLATEEEAPLIQKQMEKFADSLDECGLPRRLTRSITHWPAFAIDVQVEEQYEQTPGPKAGSRL
jgi:hypothetical protein